jgi:hypothetical protein
VEIEPSRVRLALRPATPDLLDREHPGWLGLLVRGETGGIEAAAQAVERRARVGALGVRGGRIEIEVTVDPKAAPVEPPQAAAVMSFSTATSWSFDLLQVK